jgi:uncharacterized repeat protein (TIGR03803 family)
MLTPSIPRIEGVAALLRQRWVDYGTGAELIQAPSVVIRSIVLGSSVAIHAGLSSPLLNLEWEVTPMRKNERHRAPTKAFVTIVMALILVSSARAGSKYKVLHAFTGRKDGGGLWGSLVFDTKGNLYGMTSGDGAYGYGVVFELTPGAQGHWSETVLYSFHDPYTTNDGGIPFDGLIFDPAGNLYGTTIAGGTHHSGTAFELISGSSGWTESILYNFCAKPNCTDGGSPYAGLVMDKAGNLYGTGYAAFGLFTGSDGWTEAALHDFTCRHSDGCEPIAGLIVDAAGNLYGTTEHGGSSRCGGGCGTVYQLTPTPDGKWSEHILHRFQARGDGSAPGVGALVFDGTGNLYGTATGGGQTGYGVVFKLTPGTDGHWKETVLHSFGGFASGQEPGAGVVMDTAGNLYGTTISGGTTSCGCGVVYRLAPGSNGKWTYAVLHRFIGFDGAQPDANLILDSKGNLYGTTTTGGAGGAGVAFEITP